MYQHPHFCHVTNEYFLLKDGIFHDFGILDLRTTEPFRSDSRTFFSNLRTFGLMNLRTHEPSNLRTFGLIGCNRGMCNLSWTPHSNLEKDNSLKTTPVLAQIWAVWSIGKGRVL